MAKHSRHNIGLEARGKKVKTYYDLIAHHGRVSETEEVERLKKGIRQIQNIVQKRIKRLEAYEKKTGIKSGALEALRETGFGKGVSTRGDIDTLRESYQAGVQFLKSKQSTIKGIEESKKSIEASLREVGWKSKKGLTGIQYERYQTLAKKFYSEEAKMIYYMRAMGTMDRETLRKTANEEIKKLLRIGNIDEALNRADKRLEKMYEDAMKESENF